MANGRVPANEAPSGVLAARQGSVEPVGPWKQVTFWTELRGATTAALTAAIGTPHPLPFTFQNSSS